MRAPLTSLTTGPRIPVDTAEARAAEQWWVDHIGQALRSRLWGQGIKVVEFQGSSFTGWSASAQLDSGKVVTTPVSMGLALALDTHQGDREDWADAVVEHCYEQLMNQLKPAAPEPSENDMVSAGYIGNEGLGQVELHPDFAHKLGDLKHEIHQIVTGRKL